MGPAFIIPRIFPALDVVAVWWSSVGNGRIYIYVLSGVSWRLGVGVCVAGARASYSVDNSCFPDASDEGLICNNTNAKRWKAAVDSNRRLRAVSSNRI